MILDSLVTLSRLRIKFRLEASSYTAWRKIDFEIRTSSAKRGRWIETEKERRETGRGHEDINRDPRVARKSSRHPRWPGFNDRSTRNLSLLFHRNASSSSFPPKFARIRFILSSFSAAESISLIRELAAWKMERGDWVGLGIEGFGNRILSFFFSLSLFFLFVEEYRRTSDEK